MKDFGAVRLDSREAKKIGETWCRYFELKCSENNVKPLVRPVVSYYNKDTHGDIDILVNNKIREFVEDHDVAAGMGNIIGFVDLPFIPNGPVTSFAHFLDEERKESFQVDVIYVPEDKFSFAYGYFAYNDLGNLVGRVAHKMGMKFGHDGLWYPFRRGTHQVKEILVTKDFVQAMEFLGFSIDIWNLGFYDLEDIFEYVSESERFNRDLYPLEHRSHTARMRDRKRPTYTKFLRWLDEHKEIPDKVDYPEDKSFWLPEIIKRFPDFGQRYDETELELDLAAKVKEKFNGQKVMNWTGLQGKELGHFIEAFKKQYHLLDIGEFTSYILENEDHVPEEDVKWYFEWWKYNGKQ